MLLYLSAAWGCRGRGSQLVVLLPWSGVLHTPPGQEPGACLCQCSLWCKKPLDCPQGSNKCLRHATAQFPVPRCYRESTASPQSLCKAIILFQQIFIVSLQSCKCLSRVLNCGECTSQSLFFCSFIQKGSRSVTVQRCCVPCFEPTGLCYIHMK